MSKIKRNGTKPQVLSAREAVEYIADQDTVAVSGAGGGIVDPYALINALHERYVETGCPKNLRCGILPDWGIEMTAACHHSPWKVW